MNDQPKTLQTGTTHKTTKRQQEAKISLPAGVSLQTADSRGTADTFLGFLLRDFIWGPFPQNVPSTFSTSYGKRFFFFLFQRLFLCTEFPCGSKSVEFLTMGSIFTTHEFFFCQVEMPRLFLLRDFVWGIGWSCDLEKWRKTQRLLSAISRHFHFPFQNMPPSIPLRPASTNT